MGGEADWRLFDAKSQGPLILACLPAGQTFPSGVSWNASVLMLSLGTVKQHTWIRVVRKKKVILKKRKKPTSPSSPVTAKPLVTTSPARMLNLLEKQEPGTPSAGPHLGLQFLSI